MIEETTSDTSMSSEINEIAGALSKAQSELESAKKDKSGYGYNYSDLAAVISTAKDILAKNNLSIVQLVGKSNEKEVELTTILTHESGQFFKSNASIAIPVATLNTKGKETTNLAQRTGSAITYLRRYSYQAILGMSSEDNDASSQPSKKAELKTAKVSKPSQWT